MLKSHLGPLYPFLKIFLLLLVILTAARSCLVFIFSQHLHGVEQLGHVFLQGIRIDFLLFSALFMLPLFAYTVLHTLIGTTTAGMMRIVVYWTVMAVVLILFFELITPWYMFEYGARPERKFFEYLSSPREVMLMLWGMYGFLMLGILLVVTASVPVIYRLAVSFYSSAGRWSVPQMLVILPLVVLLMLLGIRSSLDHRPLNPSTVAFSDDTIANALPLNSLYSVLYAAYSMKNEAAASDVYGHMAKQEILNRVYREHEKHNSGNFNAVNYPTPPFPRKNLVIILEESLGARFVGKLGGAALTPKLDQLADEGWWFTHLYATGTRSVLGNRGCRDRVSTNAGKKRSKTA